MDAFLNSIMYNQEEFLVFCALAFGAVIVLLLTIAFCIRMIIPRGMRRRPAKDGIHENPRALSQEEDEMLRQMWGQMQKMEERIMNLETILMHQTPTREFNKRT